MDVPAPYEHQVAGSHSSASSQLLRGEYGRLLKPYKLLPNSGAAPLPAPSGVGHTEDPRHASACSNERVFYELCNERPELSSLRALMPRYYGETLVAVAETPTPHLILEDLTIGCALPCVADLKMGAVRSYPGRHPLKHRADKEKYRSQQEVGWCIAGLRQHSPQGELHTCWGPVVGRTLDTEQTKRYLQSFVTLQQSDRQKVVVSIIDRVSDILRWFNQQRLYWFRSSSILLVYNAEHFRQHVDGPILESLDDTRHQAASVPAAVLEGCDATTRCAAAPTSDTPDSKRYFKQTEAADLTKQCDVDINSCINAERNNEMNTTETKTGIRVNYNSGRSSQECHLSDTPNALASKLDRDLLASLAPTCISVFRSDAGGGGSVSADSSGADLHDTSTPTAGGPPLIVRVKMIDFAHVLDGEGEKDYGYVMGLENLLQFLKECQNE